VASARTTSDLADVSIWSRRNVVNGAWALWRSDVLCCSSDTLNWDSGCVGSTEPRCDETRRNSRIDSCCRWNRLWPARIVWPLPCNRGATVLHQSHQRVDFDRRGERSVHRQFVCVLFAGATRDESGSVGGASLRITRTRD